MCLSGWLGFGVDSIAAALSLLGRLSVQSWVLNNQKCRRSELAVAPTPLVERWTGKVDTWQAYQDLPGHRSTP